MARQPNIVFLHNDHQASYQWNSYGFEPKRPYFNRLAEDGARFANAYCAAPLCGPTRRSLLTGLYPHAHKQYHNETDPPYDHEVFLDLLWEHGYDNYYYGKWHAGPGNALEHHCKGFSPSGYGNPYTTAAYREYLQKRGLPQAEHLLKYCFALPLNELTAPYRDKLQPGRLYRSEDPLYCGEHAAGITTTPKDTYECFFLANSACDKLEELARDASREKPFFLRVDFWGPHQPYFPTQEYYDLYKDVEFAPYPSYASRLEGKPEVYFRERNVPIGENDRLIIPNAVEWPVYNDLLRYCAAHITMVDEAGGRVLAKLRELGLEEDTLVIWTTDHGDALACHGGHFDKGSYLCQEVLRVPMALKWPAAVKPGQEVGELVNTASVPATILDAAGLRFGDPCAANSLLPLVQGGAPDWPDFVVCESYGHGYGEYVTSRAVVTERYKYVAVDGQLHELYDLEADPCELTNLIDDPGHAGVLLELRRKLKRWQLEHNDPAQLVDRFLA